MHNLSITAKITIITCSILAVFLFGGSIMLRESQKKLINDFINENLNQINHSIDSRENIEKELLHKNVKFNTETLSHACAGYLWQYIIEGLKETLRSYMNYPEIIAIRVVDESGQTAASAWKSNQEIIVAEELPDDIHLNKKLYVQSDSLKDEKKVGVVQVYYTDEVLKKDIKNTRKETLSEARMVHENLRSRFKGAYKFQLAGTLILIMLLALFLNLFIRILVLKPLKKISDIAEKLAAFDLTVNTDSNRKDEIGNLLMAVRDMVESFREIISKSSDTAEKVTSSSGEISDAVSEQVAVTTQQSATVSEISSTMEELSASSSQIANNSNSVVEIASETLKTAQDGTESLKTVMKKMDKINRDNQNNIREIMALGKKSDEITKVMGIINSIADQTKLIAFNAALEAASAGEEGKRFGVVAAEIRRLASNVTESTGEIENRIQEIQEASRHMVIASEESSKGIQEGLESFSGTSHLLNKILEGAESTTDAAKQISLATRQQKTATDQVVTALKDIARGAEQTSVSINNISSISNKLAELSGDLRELMKRFILA